MRERDEAISAEYQRFFKDEPKELDSTTFTGKFLEAQIGGVFSPTTCLLYTSPSPRDRTRSRMPSSA